MSIIIPGRDLEELADRLTMQEGYLLVGVAEDGSQVIALRRSITGGEIVGGCDEFGCSDVWSYAFLTRAVLEFMQWNGDAGTEPEGWRRHMPSGRRRLNGDPATEEIRP